jgi:CrcB protein
MILLLLVSLAGGLGAASRFLLDGAVTRRSTLSFPVATLTINVTGSFLLGALTEASAATDLSVLPTVAGVGFLGGFTTFSTASVELVGLVRSGRWVAAVVLGVSMLLLSVGAALLGILIARVLTG